MFYSLFRELEEDFYDSQNYQENNWKKDYQKYPGTLTDRNNRPFLYKFVLNGYKCELLRTNTSKLPGNWCGYVIVPPDHIACQYNVIKMIEVYNGIHHYSVTDKEGILSFYTPHPDDLIDYRLPIINTYKDYNFVKNELINLSNQLYDLELRKQNINTLLICLLKSDNTENSVNSTKLPLEIIIKIGKLATFIYLKQLEK